MNTFVQFVTDHPSHALPILATGVVGAWIILDRTRALFQAYPMKNTPEFFEKIQDLVLSGKVGEAINQCDKHPGKPVALVVKQALMRANQPESLIEQGLQIAVADSSKAVQKRTSFLATIANVATLLGLFGTILGLIHSFEAVGHADPQQKSALLAAGISTAMNATMLGLGVAIPCMVAFSWLMNRSNQLVGEIDQAAVRTIDILKQRYYAVEAEAMNPRSTEDLPEDDNLIHLSSAKSLRKAA